jgi:hypothetical protein
MIIFGHITKSSRPWSSRTTERFRLRALFIIHVYPEVIKDELDIRLINNINKHKMFRKDQYFALTYPVLIAQRNSSVRDSVPVSS